MKKNYQTETLMRKQMKYTHFKIEMKGLQKLF